MKKLAIFALLAIVGCIPSNHPERPSTNEGVRVDFYSGGYHREWMASSGVISNGNAGTYFSDTNGDFIRIVGNVVVTHLGGNDYGKTVE